MIRRVCRRAGVAVGVLVLAAPLSGQFISRGKDPVDPFPLAPAAMSAAPHLEWTKAPGAHIANPDFFCTSCAREKRIPFRKRKQMAEVLALGFPPLSSQSRPLAQRTAAFELMGESGIYVLQYLFKEMEPDHPVYVEDGLFRLFCDLNPGHIARGPGFRSKAELASLREVFPKLGARTRQLTSHQRAHLYLIRAHRVLRDVLDLFGFDPADSSFRSRGPYLGNRQKLEIYLFDRQSTLKRFTVAYRGNYPDADGFDYYFKKNEASVVAACPAKSRDAWLNATFTHRLALCLLEAYQGRHQIMPAWFTLGFGHLFERRESAQVATIVLGAQPVNAGFLLRSFRADVVRRVKQNRYPPFSSLCRKTRFQDISARLRPVVWSQVRFLLSLGRPEFARFVGRMKRVTSGGSAVDASIEGLKTIYNLTPEGFEKAWRVWVLEGLPGVPRPR